MISVDADVRAALAEGAEKDILRDAINNVDRQERGAIVVSGMEDQIQLHREQIRAVYHQIHQFQNEKKHERASLDEQRERLKRSYTELENDLILATAQLEAKKATELTRMAKVVEAHQAAIAVLEGTATFKKPNPAS